MLKLNKKGQASSTFQLLIAAIVALAILGVLISVIGGIGGISGDPSTTTRQKVKEQINSPGAVSCTTAVEFSKSKTPELAASAVITDSGLDRRQVFFSTQPDEIAGFTVSDNKKTLKYDSSTKKKVAICVVCDEHLATSSPIVDKLDEERITEITQDIIGETNQGQTVCVVFPRKTT